MKKIQILLVLALLSTSCIKVQGQTDTDADMQAYYTQWHVDHPTAAVPAKALRGTYQFFILGEDSTQLLRTDLAEKIESYRDENTVVHLKVSSTTTIKILPRKEINSEHFIPLTNEVIFQHDYYSQSAKK